MSYEEREKKNQRIAMATSIAVHIALFIVFLFAVAWRAPDPPLPEVGIELNFGLDAQGSGEVQPEKPVGEPVENQEEELTSKEEITESQPQEVKQVAAPTEQQVSAEHESPVVVKKEEKKEVVKPKEEVKEKSEVTTKPKEEVKAVYKPANKTETKTGETGTQGDDKDKTGDKGSEQGTLDSKALYGKPGGGDGGSSLDLAGWQWDEIPKPNVPNNESGRVVFEIKVDNNGEIISIRTLERSVSLEAENICRKEIEKLTFTKTGSNVPAVSTGKITFVVRSK